jgi:predicted dienelactone hydrolase
MLVFPDYVKASINFKLTIIAMKISLFKSKSLLSQVRINRIFGWFGSLAIGSLSMMISSAQAAERVEFRFGPLEIGVSVKELETFSKEDVVGRDLNFFISRVAESDRKYVRKFLTLKPEFTALQVSQFFYSTIGENILNYTGELIQTDGHLNGSRAIRSALILAAADPEGLTLLNFLQKFPSSTLRLDVERGLVIAAKIDNLGRKTARVISGLEKLSIEAAESEPKIDLKTMANLGKAGPHMVKIQSETLNDAKRNRKFNVDFYLPQSAPQPAPVIVLSHGLASDRQHFASLAKHLASYGFVSMTIAHPGSDSVRLQNLLLGLNSEVFDVSEFIDRPKDISYVLDDVAQRFPRAVNTDQAGVIGHSFGGYAAMAVAGAVIDFDYLSQACSQPFDSANASILLQCTALKLPRQTYNFRDPRIKFALAINPVMADIFGPKGLAEVKIPVAIASGANDPVANAVLEQIEPFSWMVAPERYLFVVQGLSHVADIRSLTSAFIPSLDSFIPDRKVEPIKENGRVFILALVETYVRNQITFRPYLQANFAIAVSEDPNKVSILRTLTPEKFKAISSD